MDENSSNCKDEMARREHQLEHDKKVVENYVN